MTRRTTPRPASDLAAPAGPASLAALASLAATVLLCGGSAMPASASWGTAGAGAGASESVEMQPPSDVVATCLPGMVIQVRWTPSELRSGYAVQRSLAGGPWATVATSQTAAGDEWEDRSLVNLLGVAVRWRVVDTYLGWTSPPSPASNTRMISLAGVCL